MSKEFNDENIRNAFGESQKNPFVKFESDNTDFEISAMLEAKRLNEYLKMDKFSKTEAKGIQINTKNGSILNFHSVSVLFKSTHAKSCSVDISVPMSFNGDIRLWTENFIGQKVWSTVDKIYISNCNPDILFDFLGKYTNRFNEQDFDDLPF